MPGLHTDYWQRTCPCCTTVEADARYCRKCDDDVATYTDTASYDDCAVDRCTECGEEIGEPYELDEIDADMEWFETARKERE